MGNARHLQQAFGFVLDDLEGGFSEIAHDAFGQLWANALDHPGAEITFHPRNCRRQHLFANFGLELLAMLWVVVPDPLYAQVFTGNEFWQVADYGDQTVKTQTG